MDGRFDAICQRFASAETPQELDSDESFGWDGTGNVLIDESKKSNRILLRPFSCLKGGGENVAKRKQYLENERG